MGAGRHHGVQPASYGGRSARSLCDMRESIPWSWSHLLPPNRKMFGELVAGEDRMTSKECFVTHGRYLPGLPVNIVAINPHRDYVMCVIASSDRSLHNGPECYAE